MNLTLIFLVILLVYALFFMWPLKNKIYKKNGRILSNLEIHKMANEGDIDSRKLRKRGKYFYILGFFFVVFFILEKYRFINY